MALSNPEMSLLARAVEKSLCTKDITTNKPALPQSVADLDLRHAYNSIQSKWTVFYNRAFKYKFTKRERVLRQSSSKDLTGKSSDGETQVEETLQEPISCLNLSQVATHNQTYYTSEISKFLPSNN